MSLKRFPKHADSFGHFSMRPRRKQTTERTAVGVREPRREQSDEFVKSVISLLDVLGQLSFSLGTHLFVKLAT